VSLRLRALLLVLLVAVTATAATAWLTLRQATQQVQESAAVSQQQTSEITTRLQEYGETHASWIGVGSIVRDLSVRTGQRIRVETATRILVADSDTLGGRRPRGVIGAPLLVDARPRLVLPVSQSPAALARLTIGAIAQYRNGAAYAACLTRTGAPVVANSGDNGIPEYRPVSGSTSCSPATTTDPGVPADSVAAFACAQKPAAATVACLTQLFDQRIVEYAPELLRVYLGAEGESAPSLRFGPTLLAATAVVVAAMLGALVLSRSVLGPIRTLMAAAQSIGRGHRAGRVPVSGRDEIAQLGRAFNVMAESLQAAEASQRRTTADIAHELRNPLANLRGYLEAMRDGVIAPTPELLDSLHDEVLLQQRIVDDLQDLAMADVGQRTYRRCWLDLHTVAEACASGHVSAAEAAGIRLILEPGPPVPLMADPDRLRQVVGNLVSNAIRATPAGGVVRLRTRDEGDTAVLEVTDTGTGIATDDLPHVFDRFWRADPARGRATGGAGLGLAIARQIVTDHSGSIDVASLSGAGTTFAVRLPMSAGPRPLVADRVRTEHNRSPGDDNSHPEIHS